jgi:hypothetical protein
MASTYSSLKFELITTGEQDGTWGNTTNTNLGTAIEQAITGTGDVTFTSADVTLTLTNSNSAQVARNLRLVLVGTSGGARQLIVPAIEKQYIIKNELADAVTVKNASGTGIAIPSGRTTVVFNDGTNIVEVVTYISSLALSNVSVSGDIAAGGNVTVTGVVSGNAAGLTNINASNISSGTIANARTTAASANGASTVVLRDSNGSFTANAVNVTSIQTTNFTITESSGKLVFKYGANVVASIDSTGNLISATNITAFGTP